MILRSTSLVVHQALERAKEGTRSRYYHCPACEGPLRLQLDKREKKRGPKPACPSTPG